VLHVNTIKQADAMGSEEAVGSALPFAWNAIAEA
jgi:hypothetical protein